MSGPSILKVGPICEVGQKVRDDHVQRGQAAAKNALGLANIQAQAFGAGGRLGAHLADLCAGEWAVKSLGERQDELRLGKNLSRPKVQKADGVAKR
jgi:hypothetical protein